MANTNNLPNDITIDILLNLPQKSLLRFKSVCKSWRSLIEDPQFVKNHYYLNQILQALEKAIVCSIDDPIIKPPSVISHQLCSNFLNTPINGLVLLALPLSDKIVFWNPEDLSESTTIPSPISNTAQVNLGERIYKAKPLILPFADTSWNVIHGLEVRSLKKNGSWGKMLEIEEQGPVFLKKGKKGLKKGKKVTVDFMFYRRDKNEYVVYDSKTREFNEVADGIEAKQKLKEFKIVGPQVSLFIDHTYAETLVYPDATILEV